MAVFRVVEIDFWKNAEVIEEMNCKEKLFNLYLKTNPNTTQIGVYKIIKGQVAFDLGFSIDEVNDLLKKFENHFGIVRYNTTTKEIAIKDWGNYNLNKSGKPMIDCVKKELGKVVDKSLLEFVKDSVVKDDLRILFDEAISINENNDTCSVRSTCGGQQEHEPKHIHKNEQEQKQEYINLYEKNIGRLNSKTSEWIDYSSKDIDIDLFEKAIEIAVNSGMKNRAYINGIINQWDTYNIKTKLSLIEHEKNKYRGNKNASKSANTLQREDEQVYQKPSEDQLRRAKELLIS